MQETVVQEASRVSLEVTHHTRSSPDFQSLLELCSDESAAFFLTFPSLDTDSCALYTRVDRACAMQSEKDSHNRCKRSSDLQDVQSRVRGECSPGLQPLCGRNWPPSVTLALSAHEKNMFP